MTKEVQPDMPKGPSAATLEDKLAQVKGLHQQLVRNKLRPGQTPADRANKLQQQQVKVHINAVGDDLALSGSLGRIVKQINFDRCPLDEVALRGAMLGILDQAKDPAAISGFRERDAAFQAEKKANRTPGISAFIAVAAASAELKQKLGELKFKHNGLAGGFAGRAPTETLLALGRDFNCTVRIALGKETRELVSKGVVDDTVLALTGHGADAEAQAEQKPEAAGVPAVEAAKAGGAAGFVRAGFGSALTGKPEKAG